MLEAEGSVIMLGDVNPGARITARGNIIVLGAMRGTAIAGLGGNPHAVIVALDLNPIQIRMEDHFRKTGPPERTFRTTDCLSGYGQDPHGTVV